MPPRLLAKSIALRTSIMCSLVLLALIGAPAAPVRAQAITDAQRGTVEQIIKDYLLKNPEVIQEAIAELEKRQQDAQRTAQQTALREHADALLKSQHGSLVGNPAGDVTLVEFFDYNCGYCKRALSDLRALTKSDPKLRIVLKDFPVLGPESLAASKIALAVKQQIQGEKLFDYHSRLLESRGTVTGERALGLAKEMGLDTARLQRDAEGPDVRAALSESATLADKLGLTGTPAFVVGDEVISGAVGVDPLRQAVAAVRQCGHAVC